jgi:hypothetical protein
LVDSLAGEIADQFDVNTRIVNPAGNVCGVARIEGHPRLSYAVFRPCRRTGATSRASGGRVGMGSYKQRDEEDSKKAHIGWLVGM